MSIAATVNDLDMTFWPIPGLGPTAHLSISDLIQPIVPSGAMQCLCLWRCLVLVSNRNCHPGVFIISGLISHFSAKVS